MFVIVRQFHPTQIFVGNSRGQTLEWCPIKYYYTGSNTRSYLPTQDSKVYQNHAGNAKAPQDAALFDDDLDRLLIFASKPTSLLYF